MKKMDINYTNKSPHFDGTNNDYQEKWMCLHLEVLRRKIWGAVLDMTTVMVGSPARTPRWLVKL
jgi:UDP-N-acetyl-D-mannosaminuronic acid transferase (WecB/TagA/CpsF family)